MLHELIAATPAAAKGRGLPGPRLGLAAAGADAHRGAALSKRRRPKKGKGVVGDLAHPSDEIKGERAGQSGKFAAAEASRKRSGPKGCPEAGPERPARELSLASLGLTRGSARRGAPSSRG